MEHKTAGRDGQHQLSLKSSTNFNPAQPLHLHFTLPGIGAAGLALFWGIDSFIVKGLSFLIWSPSSLPTWYIFSYDVQSTGKRGFTIALNAFFYSCFKAVQKFFLVLPLSVLFCSSPKLFNFTVTSVRQNQKASVYFRLAKLKILLLSPPVSYCNSFCLQEIQPAFPFQCKGHILFQDACKQILPR